MKNGLTLRPLSRDGLPFLHELYSNETSARYMRYGRHTSIEQTRELLRHYLEDSCLPFALINENGDFAGYISLIPEHDDPVCGTYSATLMILPKFWNAGYGTEAVQGILKLLPDYPEVKRILGYIVDQNEGSWKIAEKCGFSRIKEIGIENDRFLYVYEYKCI